MINVSDHPEISKVIGFFEEISKIPRGSGNTDKIASYLYSFGKERCLDSFRDEYDNVVIKKPASKGYENRPALVIQGHSDIVAQKEPDCEIDMEKEGVRVYRDGDYLCADKTTLGADDGIALAYCLALLDSKDIPHPALECVFTSDEETGLTGATNISPDLISGRMMINLDSDDEGVFTVGCAGGLRADISLPISREKISGKLYEISITGLTGGHSGVEIDKGRANALKIMAEIVLSLTESRIETLYGGNADNAIPREAFCRVVSNKPLDKNKILEISRALFGEENGRIEIKEIGESKEALSKSSADKILAIIRNLPTGVYKMSEDIEGLVETSSNVAICNTGKDEFSLTVSIRSSKGEEKDALYKKVREISEEAGAKVERRGDYPGWEYKKDSALRETMCRVWREVHGKDARVVMIHAGLECGIFSDKLPGLDCVSTGPDNFDIHTPKEHLSLSSVERVWKFLLRVLKEL